MAVRLEAVTFGVRNPEALAAFWGKLLHRKIVQEDGGALVPGDLTQVGLRFVHSETEPVGRPGLHLHLTSNSPENQQGIVELALRLGACHLDVGQGPDDKHVVLVDPGGNEFCVIEPDNNYLTGTGYLGEVSCKGTRSVGLFWRDALGWPLIWDQGGQTAVQSPLGGTKVSWDSWGSSWLEAKSERHRPRFDLMTAELSSDVQRLLALGATWLSDLPNGTKFADPDGNEFELHTA